MKYLVDTYTFNAAAGTIVFAEAYSLNQLLLITNVTTNEIIYNFAAPGSGGSINNGVLTLEFNTTGMNNSDSLQIFVDVEDTAPAENLTVLQRIYNVLMSPMGYDKSLQRYRQTAVIETGTISTVTTVSTVTNQANIGGVQAQLLVNGQNVSAWQACVRSRIS
jgi:hypothetical protein